MEDNWKNHRPRLEPTQRIGNVPYYGDGICRWCRGAVKRPRRYWCSQTCIDAGMVASQPAFARRRVLDRDHGICAACGIDTEQCRRVYLALLKSRRLRETVATETGYQATTSAMLFLFDHWTGRARITSALWQADHIVPVVEGGGGCGLDGYRTLCVRCHKGETAALARRRAAARRETANLKRVAAWTGAKS